MSLAVYLSRVRSSEVLAVTWRSAVGGFRMTDARRLKVLPESGKYLVEIVNQVVAVSYGVRKPESVHTPSSLRWWKYDRIRLSTGTPHNSSARTIGSYNVCITPRYCFL